MNRESRPIVSALPLCPAHCMLGAVVFFAALLCLQRGMTLDLPWLASTRKSLCRNGMLPVSSWLDQPGRIVPLLARIFHQTGPENDGKVHVHGFLVECASEPNRTAGLRGCWRPLGGIFAPPLLANRIHYWLGAGCANLLAHRLTILPRPGEISGLELIYRPAHGACRCDDISQF